MKKTPYTIKLPQWSVQQENSLYLYLLAYRGRSARVARNLSVFFAFKNDERIFARNFLQKKNNFWLFRSNQKQFCGDFIAVDMSSADVENRQVYVMDLKQNAELKVGGGGAGCQLVKTPQAIEEIARLRGIILEGASWESMTGDSRKILEYFLQLSK